MPSSKSRLAGNLPALVSSFIGRTEAIEKVKTLIATNRLVTLTGTGGCGKTRLAYKVAEEIMGEFEGGIFLVELASLSDPALVLQSIAAVFGIHEKPGHALNRLLIEHLQTRQILLLADNCEHLIVACATILEELLQACPSLKVLATSREMLGISGEVVWNVPALSMPVIQPWKDPESALEALQVYQQSEAVRLFIARAASAVPEFTMTIENGVWIAEICRRLDGLPLGIELAAARVRNLSAAEIAKKLDDRFHLLTTGSRTGPLRQQTLTAAMDWSYSLLSVKEKKMLQRFSVFASGARLEAAESVCAGEGIEQAEVLSLLANLVNKSLVIAGRSEDGETHYRLLETIRQYARQKLEQSGGSAKTKDRCLLYFTEWAENARSVTNRTNQVVWMERFESEHDNLRAAMEWSLAPEGKVELGLRLITCMGWFWFAKDYFCEGRDYIAAMLEKIKDQDRPEARAGVLNMAADFAFTQTDYPSARAFIEESIAIYRELGQAGRPGLAGKLLQLGDMWRQSGNYEKAFSLLEEGLRIMRELKDLNGLVTALWQMGYYYVSVGDFRQAEEYFSEALPLSRQNGDEYGKSVTLSGLAETAVRQEQFDRAAEFEEESLRLRREIGDKWGIAVSLGNYAWIALNQENPENAGKLLMESLALRHEMGDRGGMAWCLEKLAKTNIMIGQKQFRKQSIAFSRVATRLLGAAKALRTPVGSAIDQVDQQAYQRDLARLRKALGEEDFSKVWMEGEGMPLEDVIDQALAGISKESIQSEKEKSGGLTGRERQVADLISQGKSNREIAEEMTIGVKTVETYITRMLNKLGFDSRVQIATWMVERNFEKTEATRTRPGATGYS